MVALFTFKSVELNKQPNTMSTLINQFIVTFSATILALIVFKFVGYLFSKKEKHDTTFESFNFLRPVDTLDVDLGRVFRNINSRLPSDIQTYSFPMKFYLGYHTDTDTASQKDLMQVISAQLELAGWIVTRTTDCNESEIILDIPRKEYI